MDPVLQALLALPSICVFGGRIRDFLRGKHHKESDIDVFIRISDEGMKLVKSASELDNADFLSICNISPDASKFVAKQIALLLVEELHYENVTIESVPSYDVFLQNYRVFYGENQKIDVVMLRQNHKADFDVNSLYWDGKLKTLMNCDVQNVCHSLQRNIALIQDSPLTNKKLEERAIKMQSYGFSLSGNKPIKLQRIMVSKYISKIDVNSVLPNGYFITGREAVLRFINAPICRHATVIGKNIAFLQKRLPFATRRIGNTLHYAAGSITLVNSAPEDVNIFNLKMNEKGGIEDLSFEQNLFSFLIGRCYSAPIEEQLLRALGFRLIE